MFSMPRFHLKIPHPANYAASTYSANETSSSLPIDAPQKEPAENGTTFQQLVISGEPNMTPPLAESQNEGAQQFLPFSISNPLAKQPSSSPRSTGTKDIESSEVTFDTFATELRLHRLQESRISILKQQQRTLQRALALSARLSRTLNQVQAGLVETLKNGDKAGFANAYHTTLDLKDACSSLWSRNIKSFDPANEDRTILSAREPDSLTFMEKLPSGSQTDVLEFIHLLRTNSSFLVDRIKRLNPSQVSDLASSPKMHIPRDSIFSSMARGTSQASQLKRNAAFSKSLRDTGSFLERTTPVAALLFNVYSALPGPESGDYLLRLDTWSSTCADLYSHSGQAYHFFLNEILNAFASLHEWRAKPRIELFLMNLLQTGAFLLEPIEEDLSTNDFHFPVSDPLRTEEAEDFFDNAVRELFTMLNDVDGGLPFGALHFGSAVLGKLREDEKQSSFRGFLLYSWYFCEFLFSALTLPETKGMLLHYHVSKNARENILKEVAIRAQSRVAEFLDPSLNPTPLLPDIRTQLEQMVSRLNDIKVETPKRGTVDVHPYNLGSGPILLQPGCLTVSVSDILLLVDMLVPQPPPNPTPWDPFLNSTATAFAAQYRQGLPPLSKIFPSGQPHAPEPAKKPFPTNQSSATDLVRKFDQIRRDLHAAMERSVVYPLPHPSHDSWAVLELHSTGYPVIARPPGQGGNSTSVSHVSSSTSEIDLFPQIDGQNLDTVQRASLRLIDEHSGLISTPRFNSGTDQATRIKPTLERLFAVELDCAEANADSRNAQYWWTALRALRTHYPLSQLAQNDTRILRPILSISRQSNLKIQQETETVEINLRYLEEGCDKISGLISDILGRLHRLRDKMWYLADVTNSNIYEVTRNIALALRNMASSSLVVNQSSSASIRGRKKPRSLAESILQEPEAQTISIMKAPLDQGGPRKLADEQIDMTRKWFQRFGVDNFCKGEERIHRFCMEIRIAASRLVGETMLESPVLWSSELYFRQRTFVDGLVTRSMPASSVTRPSSILSEEGPTTTSAQTHQISRGFESGSRPQLFDSQSSPGRKSSFHSLGSDRWRTMRDFHGGDALSIVDSPGRAVSATTVDSTNSFWSPLPTQPQSAASVSSLPSRPPSFMNDSSSPRPVDQSGPRRVKFFEELRQRVICLLLSDLGSPVWSCGSETDTWLADMLAKAPIQRQLRKREGMEKLLGNDRASCSSCVKGVSIVKSATKSRRSTSSGPRISGNPKPGPSSFASTPSAEAELEDPLALLAPADEFCYQAAYEDLMRRFSKQADPILKLDILHDLKSLVISSLQENNKQIPILGEKRPTVEPASRTSAMSAPSSRRTSWNPASFSEPPLSSQKPSDDAKAIDTEASRSSNSVLDEKQVIDGIKSVLMTTRPKTLFRDLQFITAFVPSDILNKTPGGKAFLHVGLAALAFKDDVCRSLVSVADKIMINDNVKRRSPPLGSTDYSLRDAVQMWILAAKEGNATAQRELAVLYLSSPELLPSVSSPLTAPRDIFRSEMKYWPADGSKRLSSQAMCLALHWMQLAASNGDGIAKRRLEEREVRS